jgi:hypothetical protein
LRSLLRVFSKPSLKGWRHCRDGNGLRESRTGTIKVSVADGREHKVKMTEFTKWLDRPGGSQRETIQRQRVRSILGMTVMRE